MTIDEILRLLKKKYPEKKFGFFINLRLYDDGSGAIYASMFTQEELFDFDSLEVLVEHLKPNKNRRKQ